MILWNAINIYNNIINVYRTATNIWLSVVPMTLYTLLLNLLHYDDYYYLYFMITIYTQLK